MTGGGGYYTTQETVDLFFTKDGLTIEEDPGCDKFEGIPSANNFTSGRYYDPNNPSRLYFDADKSKVLKQWKDREPRFYVNITYSGSIWLNEGKYNEEMRTDFTNGCNGTCGKSKASGDCPDLGYLIRRGAKVFLTITARNTSLRGFVWQICIWDMPKHFVCAAISIMP